MMKIGQTVIMTQPKYLKGKKATVLGQKTMWGHPLAQSRWSAEDCYKLHIAGKPERRPSGLFYWYPATCFLAVGDGHAGKFKTWVFQKKAEGIHGI